MLSPVGAGKHSPVCPGLTFTAFQLLLHGTSASEGLWDGWLGRREIQTATADTELAGCAGMSPQALGHSLVTLTAGHPQVTS